MTNFAHALVAYQRQQKITQTELAYRVGVSRHWLNDFIAGRRKPYWAFAVRARQLGISAEAILGVYREDT